MKLLSKLLLLLPIIICVTSFNATYAQCNAPDNLDTTHVSANSMRIMWDNISNAVGYEIKVTLNSTPPGNVGGGVYAINNNYLLQGLERDKTYCVHIRTRCDSGQLSAWSTQCYTLPCTGFTTNTLNSSNISPNSVRMDWEALNWTGGYEYSIVMGDTTLPTRGVSTAGNVAMLQGLSPNKMYCFYLRAYCPNSGTYTEWEKYCFTTPEATSINSVMAEDKVTVSPNPATDILNISLPYINSAHNIIITDLTGRIVLSTVVSNETNNLNTSALNQGIYFLSISGKKYNTTQKILIAE